MKLSEKYVEIDGVTIEEGLHVGEDITEDENESITASAKEAWAWLNDVCKWLDCGVEGVFAIERKIRKLEDYADKLADGLPMLPKDIEVLREANLDLAVRNEAVVEAAQDFLKWSEKEGQRDNWVMGEFDELWIKLRDVLAELG